MPFVYRLEKGQKALVLKQKFETVDQLVEDIGHQSKQCFLHIPKESINRDLGAK